MLSVCYVPSLSPTVLQEPLWLCMSSAGCRTMSAGSCTATSLMTGGLSKWTEAVWSLSKDCWAGLEPGNGSSVVNFSGFLTYSLFGPAQVLKIFHLEVGNKALWASFVCF